MLCRSDFFFGNLSLGIQNCFINRNEAERFLEVISVRLHHPFHILCQRFALFHPEAEIAEKAKVEVRNVRADIKDKLKKAIKDGLSEDNEKDAESELQKIHDKFIKKIDELIDAKNKEIMTV
jgi:ribosome recycling factor